MSIAAGGHVAAEDLVLETSSAVAPVSVAYYFRKFVSDLSKTSKQRSGNVKMKFTGWKDGL